MLPSKKKKQNYRVINSHFRKQKKKSFNNYANKTTVFGGNKPAEMCVFICHNEHNMSFEKNQRNRTRLYLVYRE